MKGTKMQKGITLIALIITIVVLLILAVVAISAVQDSGIITHAQNAVKEHEKGEEKEKINLALDEWYIQKNTPSNTKTFKEVVENALSETATVSGEDNGPLTITMNDTGNKYNVTDNGEITKVEVKEGSLLEKYILGADLAGRPMTDIIDMETFSFIDDITTEEIDETQTIGANSIVVGEITNELGIMYFKCQDITYKFGFNLNTIVIDENYGVVKVYEPEEGTRVGKTVKYDDKIWTILYDDSTNGLQMISNQSLLYNNDSFYLGYNDSTITDWTKLDIETEEFKTADVDKDKTLTDFERGIYSYNKAIDTLNTACESIVITNDNIIDVRCVGSNPTNKSAENEILYTSEELEIWPIDNATYAAGIGNGRGKSTDLNYVSDFERMIALGINIGYDSTGSGSSYWLASRLINLDSERQRMFFKIREVSSEGSIGSDYLWYVIKMDVGGGNSSHTINSALRPVVSLKSDVQLVADSSGEAEYTF